MDLWNLDKLAIFIIFAIPGFLMLKINAVLGLEPQADSSKQVIDAVAYSCINYAILAWPIFRIEGAGLKGSSPEIYYAFYAVVILVAPVAWALLWRALRTTQAIQKILPHPTSRPWDYVFRQRLPYWIIVTFKDGKQVAGRYANKSFSSAAPASEQLYLEETWELSAEGGFERPRIDSAGLLILCSEVRTLEFFEVHEEDSNGNKSDPEHTSGEGVATQAANTKPA